MGVVTWWPETYHKEAGERWSKVWIETPPAEALTQMPLHFMNTKSNKNRTKPAFRPFILVVVVGESSYEYALLENSIQCSKLNGLTDYLCVTVRPLV